MIKCMRKNAFQAKEENGTKKTFETNVLRFMLWISFFLTIFLPEVESYDHDHYQSNEARISTCDRSNDKLPFSENDEIEAQLDWIDDRKEILSDMCALNVQCCSEAENISLHRYVHHSLDMENISHDDNALLDASMYVDEHLKLQDISIEKFLLIHKMVLKGKGGNFRTIDVAVQNPITKEIYPTPSHESINKTIPDYIRWIEKESQNLHAVQSAILIKLNLVKIHPFHDGNGRMSRLFFNWMLRENGGVGWISFFRADIEEYYSAVTEATTKHNMDPFLRYAVRTIAKSYDFFLNDLQNCSCL